MSKNMNILNKLRKNRKNIQIYIDIKMCVIYTNQQR